MPTFWQFPTVSMGLGPIMSASIRRGFNRYLEHRGMKDTSGQRGVGVSLATANATNRNRWARWQPWPRARSSTI